MFISTCAVAKSYENWTFLTFASSFGIHDRENEKIEMYKILLVCIFQWNLESISPILVIARDPRTWSMPRSRPLASWLRQVKIYLRDVWDAWASTRRRRKVYFCKVDAATRCSGVCHHHLTGLGFMSSVTLSIVDNHQVFMELFFWSCLLHVPMKWIEISVHPSVRLLTFLIFIKRFTCSSVPTYVCPSVRPFSSHLQRTL